MGHKAGACIRSEIITEEGLLTQTAARLTHHGWQTLPCEVTAESLPLGSHPAPQVTQPAKGWGQAQSAMRACCRWQVESPQPDPLARTSQWLTWGQSCVCWGLWVTSTLLPQEEDPGGQGRAVPLPLHQGNLGLQTTLWRPHYWAAPPLSLGQWILALALCGAAS